MGLIGSFEEARSTEVTIKYVLEANKNFENYLLQDGKSLKKKDATAPFSAYYYSELDLIPEIDDTGCLHY